ncbi:hypothetical protein [Fusibacter sp. 3D3]|uniref:hypothetical protein n=1 Tax=Fusibacter sp. 3D3 TaxID=1048380 RepID=UPI000853A636|nr:hypothetical protein [Fusibacter sp. 3D3]GAU79586.1 hypothetical protein F3D3_4250 [Fusibacter sp. 3D3]
MAKVIIPNQKFIDLLIDKSQTVVIDANLIIPPDRSSIKLSHAASLKLSFDKYKEDFLNPLFSVFPSIAIHEAVYAEIIETDVIKEYIDHKIESKTITLLRDQDLSSEEESLRNTVEGSIAQFTNYNPYIDNRKDRGEVKSLSYAVAKELVYFSTNDSNAISLILRQELEPYLHSLGAIKVYELIFAIRIFHGNLKILKGLYKLLYYLTAREKEINHDWATFCDECEKEYREYCN